MGKDIEMFCEFATFKQGAVEGNAVLVNLDHVATVAEVKRGADRARCTRLILNDGTEEGYVITVEGSFEEAVDKIQEAMNLAPGIGSETAKFLRSQILGKTTT